MRQYSITKCDRSLLQNESGFLLQNATVLLQNAIVITKYDVYYKLRQYILIKTGILLSQIEIIFNVRFN